MTWQGDPRTSSAEWKRKRRLVLERDLGVCHVCHRPGATDVDHVVALAEGGDDSEANLAPIHPRPCHAKKSAAEGNRARWARPPRRRQPEQHPGRIIPPE